MVLILVTDAQDEPLRFRLENMLQFQRIEVLVVLIAGGQRGVVMKSQRAAGDIEPRHRKRRVREAGGVVQVAVEEQSVISRRPGTVIAQEKIRVLQFLLRAWSCWRCYGYSTG